MDEQGDGLLSWCKPDWQVIKAAPRAFIISVLAVGVLELVALYWVFHANLEIKNDLIASKTETIAMLEKKLLTLPVPIATPQIESDTTKPAETTRDVSLFLQFSDSNTVPTEIRQTNVPFWRALYSPSASVKDNKGKQLFSVPPHWFIVLWFDKPAIYRQMLARCAGSDSLNCAVHESNDRFAIITIAGDVSLATLEVSVKQ
jgi:hypothetical protein